MPGLGAKHGFATVAASQTSATLVAAVTGRKIRVLQIAIVSSDTTPGITLGSNTTAGTPLSPVFPLSVALPYSPVGWFETASGEKLAVTTAAGSAVVIQLAYELVTP